MKLAYLSSAAIPSTSANSLQVMKMCQALVGECVEVALYAPVSDAESTREELEHAYGVAIRFEIRRIRPMPLLGRRGLAPAAMRAARRAGCEAIYTRGMDFAWWAGMAGYPTLLELHQPPTGIMGRLYFRRFLHAARGYLAVISRRLEEKLRREYPALRDRSILIAPDAVDWEQYQDLPSPRESRIRIGMAADAFTAGYFGSLVPGRGLELMELLAQRLPEVTFMICGGNADSIKHWRSRNSGSNIHWMGHIPNFDVPLHQAACDVLLMPYERRVSVQGKGDTSETMSPMKLYEYMAAGRAIMASDLPALREILNSDNSILLPPEDALAWESALRKMISNPKRVIQLGGRAKTDVAPFTWQHRARAVLAFAFGH